MIVLDIGGTKTLIWFRNKIKMREFANICRFGLKEINNESKFCIIDTGSISERENFYDFLSIIRSLDKTIISTFPGIVRMELDRKPRFKVFSRRFSFLNGKYLDLDFVLNDAPAFTYYHALSFFDKQENRDKILLGITIGTGLNAAYMNYWDFKRLNFINRFFEAGHLSFDRSKNPCFCGRSGCAELYISGKFLESLGNGDPKAVFADGELEKTFYSNLADYLVSLIVTVSPHEIVFGGGVSRDLDTVKLKEMVEGVFPHGKIDLGIVFRKDKSRLSNVKGLLAAYKSFKRDIRKR